MELDDSLKNIVQMILMFKSLQVTTLKLKKCSLQDPRSQTTLFREPKHLVIIDTFIKFQTDYEMLAETVKISGSTVFTCPGLSFRKCWQFSVTKSHVNNPEFVHKPLSSEL